MSWLLRMVLYISLISLPIIVYLIFRTTTALKTNFDISVKKSRLYSLIIAVWFYCLPLVYLFSYLNNSSGEIFIYRDEVGWQDFILLYPFWILLIIILESLPFFLFADLLLIIKRFRKKENSRAYKLISLLKIIVLGFFIMYVPIKVYFDTNTISVNNCEIPINKNAAFIKDLSLTLLADIQIDRFSSKKKIETFQAKYANLKTDMILFAGDIVTSGRTYINQAVDLLCEKAFQMGKFACLGDHDFWADPLAVETGLVNCGWNFLKNKHQVIPHKGGKILITGITHIYSDRISVQQAKNVLANAPAADYKILLVHQPAEFLIELADKYGYNLLLAGHTHGGQIVQHIFGFPVTPSAFETDYYHGYYKYNRMHVLVSTGIGLSLAPIRYHSSAEIATVSFILSD